MAVYIDDTILLRQLEQWLDAVGADIEVVCFGDAPPDNADSLVLAYSQGLTYETRDRRSTDDNDIAAFEYTIGVSVGENQTSGWSLPSAVAQVRNAIECKGTAVTGHQIHTDTARCQFTAGRDSQNRLIRECLITVRGQVICTSTASPEDRID